MAVATGCSTTIRVSATELNGGVEAIIHMMAQGLHCGSLVISMHPAYAGRMSHLVHCLLCGFVFVACTAEAPISHPEDRTASPLDASISEGALTDLNPLEKPSSVAVKVDVRTLQMDVPTGESPTQHPVHNTVEIIDDCGPAVQALLRDITDFEAQRTQGLSTQTKPKDLSKLRLVHSQLSARIKALDEQSLSPACRERCMDAEIALKRHPPPAPAVTHAQPPTSLPPSATVTQSGAPQDKLMKRLLCMQACHRQQEAARRQLCLQTCQLQ